MSTCELAQSFTGQHSSWSKLQRMLGRCMKKSLMVNLKCLEWKYHCYTYHEVIKVFLSLIVSY